MRGKKAGKKVSAIHKAYGRVSSHGIHGIRGSNRLAVVGSAEFYYSIRITGTVPLLNLK